MNAEDSFVENKDLQFSWTRQKCHNEDEAISLLWS